MNQNVPPTGSGGASKEEPLMTAEGDNRPICPQALNDPLGSTAAISGRSVKISSWHTPSVELDAPTVSNGGPYRDLGKIAAAQAQKTRQAKPVELDAGLAHGKFVDRASRLIPGANQSWVL